MSMLFFKTAVLVNLIRSLTMRSVASKCVGSYSDASMASILKNFSRALAQRLNELGWDQKKCAEKCGVAQSTVSDWISGQRLPRAKQWDRLCEQTGLDMPYGEHGGGVVTKYLINQLRALGVVEFRKTDKKGKPQ